MQSIKTVGLLGGSFDPIHKGHLELGKRILKDGCDEVWFIPCQASPLKDRKISDFDLRVKMIKAAIKPFKKMVCHEVEKNLPVPSYTINTLRVLRKQYPDIRFRFYIGNDQAKQLHKWNDIEKCFEIAEFRVFKRDDEVVECPYPIKSMNNNLLPYSSTQIREGRLQDVPKATLHVLWQNRLYLDSILKHAMSEKRYNHSVSVADLCKDLAHAHHLDEDIAYTAGLLHDICKEWSHEKSESWMRIYEPAFIDEPSAIWHGYLADHVLKKLFPVREREILKACHHHVKGESRNPYAMIVYIADKLDPSRGYDSSKTIELAKKNLKAGYLQVMKDQQEYLKKEKNQ